MSRKQPERCASNWHCNLHLVFPFWERNWDLETAAIFMYIQLYSYNCVIATHALMLPADYTRYHASLFRLVRSWRPLSLPKRRLGMLRTLRTLHCWSWRPWPQPEEHGSLASWWRCWQPCWSWASLASPPRSWELLRKLGFKHFRLGSKLWRNWIDWNQPLCDIHPAWMCVYSSNIEINGCVAYTCSNMFRLPPAGPKLLLMIRSQTWKYSKYLKILGSRPRSAKNPERSTPREKQSPFERD